MLMMPDERLLQIGDFVDFADISPPSVPVPSEWFILKLRPNKEWKVERDFIRAGISYYLPRLRKSAPIHRQRRIVPMTRVVPLFHGLVFVPDFEVHRGLARGIAGVSGQLHIGEDPARLSCSMIADIRRIEADQNIPLSKAKRRFDVGQQVIVTGGPFEMWTGRITRLDPKGRIRVLIDALKRAIPVEVTEDQVEPA